MGANAQRADCPRLDAPMPMSPPGKPPLLPKVTFPETLGGEVKVEMPPSEPPDDNPIEAEEGHIARVARMGGLARHSPPPEDILRELVDHRKTALSEWRFLGYVRDMPRHKVPRVFDHEGSVLVFEQWNMKADGIGEPHAVQYPNGAVGRFPARSGGMRSPSGCVSANLHWYSDGTYFLLEIAGPLSAQQQHAILASVARSIAAATPTR
jgi:hypothetical protein